jgi:uncharacterized protein
MNSWLEETEALVHKGRIKVPYQWWVGDTGTRFFVSIRDEGKITGTYCQKCDMVFVPPRQVCGRCFSSDLAWREVGTEGELISYTVPRYKLDIHPLDKPFAYGIVKLDGADTALTHLVGEFDEGQLKTGIRMKAVFKPERVGNILDILYFKPA